jgi:hypothetical protein
MPPRLAHQALQRLTPPDTPELAALQDERALMAAQPDQSRPVGDRPPQPPTHVGPLPGPQHTCTLSVQPPALQPLYLSVHNAIPDPNTKVGGAGMRAVDISTASEVIYSLFG